MSIVIAMDGKREPYCEEFIDIMMGEEVNTEVLEALAHNGNEAVRGLQQVEILRLTLRTSITVIGT